LVSLDQDATSGAYCSTVLGWQQIGGDQEAEGGRRKRGQSAGMSGYVLGIDGGQTATKAAVCDLKGRLVGLGRAGPANHVWERGGAARARRAVTRSMTAALRSAGLKIDRFEAAFLGITGATGHTRRALAGRVPAKRLRLENDKVNALASVTGGKPGVVVIAGTGTITYGENSRGRSADASGWGYLLGDEGGGFWIARRGIAAACRAYDGRGEPTVLSERLPAAAGLQGLWGLHEMIYSGRLSRADTAALAAAVEAAACDGDRVARSVLGEAGRELGLAAGTVARRLGMHRGRTTVGMVGGVFRGSTEVRRTFRREVRRHVPGAVFAEARFAPVFGAVLLALKMAGVRVTPRLAAALEKSSAAAGAD
jgi:N-acetylglucosamine kinase-like BadF-type ATPase